MSNSIRLILVLHNHQPVGNFDHVIEQAYQDAYKPFLDVFERYENFLLVVEDYEDIASHIISIRAALTSKANIRDVNILFSQLELRIRELEMQKAELGRRLSLAEASLAALRGT